jgi:signal recognition particle receptor subunit beta
MVFFNASTRELTAKIVYYGPGLGGKTTNLQVLHRRLEPGTAGELVQLSTETDRTIYFDLLPVELGEIRGYRIRFQLTTVPGQTAFNETRRVVLKGADGIVFVADSQWTLLPKNLESWQSLGENLAVNGLALDAMPVVVQYNKRDLPDILSVEAMQEALALSKYPHVEAVASEGRGVTETFKLISRLTFLDLLKRLQGRPAPEAFSPAGEEGARASSPPAPVAPPYPVERPRPLTLVRPLSEEAGAPGTPPDRETDDSPFPDAGAPFDAPGSTAAPDEILERLRSLEARLAASESRSEAVEGIRARLDETARKLEEARERLASDVTSLERRTEERIRGLEERLDAETSRGRGAQENLVEELRHLRERAERLDEQTSAFARDLEQMQRELSERGVEPRAADELKFQLAPLLEEQVRRGTDANWTAEIERLRQALAESLEDLSERVRRAVRG